MRETVRQFLSTLSIKEETIVAAVSGGVDSLALLHILAALQDEFGFALHAASYDHGWRGEDSAEDAAYAGKIAEGLGLSVTLGAAEEPALSEAGARLARYTFLAETAQAVGAHYIALGHHRDDQAETLLLHLIRGTGLAGLRGMLPIAPLSENHLLPDVPDELLEAEIKLIRPLLGVPRAEIEEYAKDLNPRQDASNEDPHYLRNRIRLEILPGLEALNPNIREGLARLASVVQGDYAIIEQAIEEAAEELVEWGDTEGGDGEIVYIDRLGFNGLSDGIRRGLLRQVLFDLTPGLGDLPYQQIERACLLIQNGAAGQEMNLPAEMILTVGYDEFMIRYGGEIPFPHFIPHLEPNQVVPLPMTGEMWIRPHARIYSYWVLDGLSQQLRRDDPLEATLAIGEDEELTLRTRRAGDRFQPLGMNGHSQKLSDTFTNLKIPRSLRDRVALLTVNDEIAWFVAPTAGGLQGRVSQKFAVMPDSTSILRVRWELSE
jgi:tRNA(Ile)-lysidine synthase